MDTKGAREPKGKDPLMDQGGVMEVTTKDDGIIGSGLEFAWAVDEHGI